MPSIPVSYSDINSNSEETTMVSFCQDPDGRFTGALMPMPNPIDTELQWKSLIEGLISNAIAIDVDANLDGIYSFSWWAENREPSHSGMLFTRMSDEVESDSLNGYRLPGGTIGLFSLSSRKNLKNKLGVLSISGYVSIQNNRLRGDRIFGTVISDSGEVLRNALSQQDEEAVTLIGDRLNDLLNQGIVQRQDI